MSLYAAGASSRSFFDSLKRYRKIQGRGMLKLIQDHLSDGRMVRIVGADKQQYVPLTRQAVADIEYDIIVDDAPTSPNEKERTFQLITAMLPMIKDSLGPQEAALIAEYSPLPASLVEKLKQSITQRAQQQAQPDPAVTAQLQSEALKQQSEQAKFALEMEKIALERERMANEGQKMAHDQQMALIGQETERIKASAALAAATRPQPIPSERLN